MAAFRRRGEAQARLGRWKEASEDLGKAADLGWRDPEVVRPALLLVQKALPEGPGVGGELRRRVASLLRQPPRTLEYSDGGLAAVIWTASLLPEPGAALGDWLPFLQKAPMKDLSAAERSRVLGAARCRLGRWKEARASLEEACKGDPDGGTAWDWFFLALTHRGQKQPEAARQALERGRAWVKEQQAGRLRNVRHAAPLSWLQKLELETLEAEAER